jgi:hypothetical protein
MGSTEGCWHLYGMTECLVSNPRGPTGLNEVVCRGVVLLLCVQYLGLQFNVLLVCLVPLISPVSESDDFISEPHVIQLPQCMVDKPSAFEGGVVLRPQQA